MTFAINLEQPLLDQEPVRDLFGEALEKEDTNQCLDNLTKLAQAFIKDELLSQGKDESELVSVKLNYAALSQLKAQATVIPEAMDIASVNNSVEEEISPPLPILEDRLSRFVLRLDEIVSTLVDQDSVVQLEAKFTGSAVFLAQGSCTCQGRYAWNSDGKTCNTSHRCIDPSPWSLE